MRILTEREFQCWHCGSQLLRSLSHWSGGERSLNGLEYKWSLYRFFWLSTVPFTGTQPLLKWVRTWELITKPFLCDHWILRTDNLSFQSHLVCKGRVDGQILASLIMDLSAIIFSSRFLRLWFICPYSPVWMQNHTKYAYVLANKVSAL